MRVNVFKRVFFGSVVFTLSILDVFSATKVQSLPNGLFENLSLNTYCLFVNILPGNKGTTCRLSSQGLEFSRKNLAVKNVDINEIEKSSENGKKVVQDFEPKKEVSMAVENFSAQTQNASKIVYIQGPKGEPGTTTVVYENKLGNSQFAPAGYVNFVSSGQTVLASTVPGDIWSTFVHQLQYENAVGANISAKNLATEKLSATTSDFSTIIFTNATGTNFATQNLSAQSSTAQT